MRNLTLPVLSILLVMSVISSSAAGRKPREINQLMVQIVDEQKRAPGIAIGIIDATGTSVYVRGACERGKTNRIDGDSLFEIGSITKVFTTTLLQDMVDRGEVKLDDPISKYLPASVKTPVQGKREITLLDLAMHTSGLPSLPENITPKDGDDPWADYSVEQMYECLANTKLVHKIGSKVDYSNFGVGLLGHILALRADTNYEALVISRICEPLGMTNSRIVLTSEMKSHLATGHSAVGPPVKNWGCLALQGDGALYSSMNDMLKFLAANMGRGPQQLCASMAKARPARKRVAPFMKIGLGWMHLSGFDFDATWHNGGTGGYRTFIGFDLANKCGAVVLMNEANDVDDVGYRLVEPDTYDSLDKFKAPQQRTVASIDPAIYDHYIGDYKLSRRETLTITRSGDHLIAQSNGTMEFPYAIFPESKTDFFYTATDAQVHFVTNAVGDATQLVFIDGGKKQKGTKVPPEKPQ
jgi:D-alanyl-D-alanine-carboxypeptidase/D-alanyl-D-alanine-endopeptidase